MKVLCFYNGEELTAEQHQCAVTEQETEFEWGINLIKATYEANHGDYSSKPKSDWNNADAKKRMAKERKEHNKKLAEMLDLI